MSSDIMVGDVVDMMSGVQHLSRMAKCVMSLYASLIHCSSFVLLPIQHSIGFSVNLSMSIVQHLSNRIHVNCFHF